MPETHGCTDEWELDGCFYDEENHGRSINYGTHAPKAYLLSFVDERTTCILDWAVTIRLEEAVLDVAERMLLKFWAPLRLVSDRAGRFRRLAGKHTTIASSGELVEILSGPLGKLGVRPRGSEEKNPRANRLERLHRIYADLARRDFGPSWRGSNVRERKLTGIDETVRRHLDEHCRRGILPPQLLSLQRVIEETVPNWVEEVNLAPTKAKGCHGLTRVAAFRQFQPPAEEIEKRKLNSDLIEAAFAEECERLIDRGVIRWTDGKEYYDAELLLIHGQRRTVTRSRHNHESSPLPSLYDIGPCTAEEL